MVDRVRKGITVPEKCCMCQWISNKRDKKNENSIKKEIIDICVQNLPEYMIPEVIEIVEDLPRTPRGKIDYRALEKSN